MLDTDIARQLGMANVYKIRELVRANAEELQSFGALSPQRGETSNKGGRPGEEFYLNRQQALLICILSKTPRAREVRAEVIRRFDAYEVPAAPGFHRPRRRRASLGGTLRGRAARAGRKEEERTLRIAAQAETEALKPVAAVGATL